METCILDGVLDILEILDVGSDHVEIGLESLASDADGRHLTAEGFAVDNELLGEDVDNFLTGLEHGVVLLGHEAVDILLGDEAVVGGNHDAAVGGARLDVLTGDAHPYLVDVDIGLVGGFAHSATDGFGGVGDILYDAMLDTLGVGLAETENLDLVVVGADTDEAGDFGGTNVETYDNFIFHDCYVLLIIISLCRPPGL